jgi:nucleotide-binding universal stress UspA family protein
MDIKNILFSTDFSEGSSLGLRYAVDMTKSYQAKLYLVHVIYDIAKATGWYIPQVSTEKLYRDIEEGAQKELDQYGLEELSGIGKVERHILKGVPYEEIVRFADENKIDLIIMGTHGRKGIDRVLFGSTASQVVRYAPCPVLTVRIPAHNR